MFDRAGNATSAVLVDGRIVGVWDVAKGPEPGVSVHLFAEQAAALRDLVEARAAALGRFWFDAEAPVTFEPHMKPLTERPAGSFTHPLR